MATVSLLYRPTEISANELSVAWNRFDDGTANFQLSFQNFKSSFIELDVNHARIECGASSVAGIGWVLD